MLSFEVSGFCQSIEDYTTDAYILNIVKELASTVEKRNVQEILYLLHIVKTWYERNQALIQSNAFVINKKMHIEIEEKIKSYISELEVYDEQKNMNVINKKNIGNRNTKRIFISHSSKDKGFCDLFIELLEGIGIPEEFILYTSSPRHGIPGDSDIFDYLKDNIIEGTTVYYMLSNHYYESVYCLNEMGAAWVTKNDFSIFFLPNFDREIEGVLDKNKKGYRLEDPIEVINFKNKLLQEFKLTISEQKWEEIKNKFLASIK